MWDAAYPPANPPQAAAVAGYIGGATPNIWSDAEWNVALSRSGARYRLPIFVRVPPTTRDPRVEARWCAQWAENHRQPHGTLICLDYETAINAAYVNAFDDVLVAAGYKCILYGSRNAVMQNPRPSGGYWTATWNNVPHIDTGATITQYGGDVTLGQPYDLSLVADSAPLWDIQGGDMLLTDADIPILRKAIGLSTTDLTEAAATNVDIATILRGDATHPYNLRDMNNRLTSLLGVLDDEQKVLAAIEQVTTLVGASRDTILGALATMTVTLSSDQVAALAAALSQIQPDIDEAAIGEAVAFRLFHGPTP
jgi:hypothetical protein